MIQTKYDNSRMKKITWSVAALLIAGMSIGQPSIREYEQGVDKEVNETLKALEFQIEDIVDAIQMDMHYGYITQDRAKYYINQVYKIKHRHRHIAQDLWRKRNITLGEHQAKLN